MIHQAEIERELKTKREAMERSNRLDAVGQLAAGIAHDFNNQLGTLRMAIERIKGAAATERSQSPVKIALKVIDESTQLATRLVALSRQENLLASNVNLHEAFDDLRALATVSVAEKVLLDVAKVDAGLVVHCDRGQLLNAMLNLVLNANDAVAEKGEAVMISVVAKRENGAVSVIVTDDGVGMSEEVLARCSDPFFTTKQNRNGTGLGLAMVQSFANENGGKLFFESTLDLGTTAKLVLPESQAENMSNQGAPTTPSDLPDVAANILLVEDQFLLAMMTKEVLEEVGFSVEVVSSAESALSYLSGENTTDLLVTDIGMPGMNGFELAKLVRERHPDIKIMFLTGYAEKPDQDLPGPIIQKPVEPAQLIATIRKVLAVA